jgi:hypothetical protein
MDLWPPRCQPFLTAEFGKVRRKVVSFRKCPSFIWKLRNAYYWLKNHCNAVLLVESIADVLLLDVKKTVT